MKKFTYLIIVSLLFNCFDKAYAQLYKVDLNEKVGASTLIVEGKVIAQQSFWNAAHTLIYTANTIELSKSFKGVVPDATVEVLTQGGAISNEFIEVSDLAQLTVGEMGIFFLYPNTVNLLSPVTNKLLYDIYASDQGVIRYNMAANKAFCPFEEYLGITTGLYNSIQAITGLYQVINPQYNIDAEILNNTIPRPQSGTITSTSPAIVNAGAILDPANNVLTINGQGFKNNPSGNDAILFKDANNNNLNPSYVVPYNSLYIISWSDTEIKLRVPSRAANGRFGVFLGIGDTAFAPQNLRVNFSVIDGTFSAIGVPLTLREPRLSAVNLSGGYDIVYSTSTLGSGSNITTSPVYNTFRRALTTWKETSWINFTEAGNTPLQIVNAYDGINIVMLDNTNTTVGLLPAGVLGATYHGFTLCALPLNAVAQKAGFDIVIRNPGVSIPSNISFEYGPCPPAYTPPGSTDMETVLLHELGHAINLEHVHEPSEVSAPSFNNVNYRNPAALMHWESNPWDVRRTPDASARNGAFYAIVPRGVPLGLCLPAVAEMTPAVINVPANDNCPLTFSTSPTPTGSVYAINLVHATSNKAVDPQFTAISCTRPVSVTNNVYQAIRTAQGGNLTMIVSNYTTVPATVAATCDTNQGVRLAIYDVNTCPAGQAFPAPIACYTITKNETLPALTGLQPNRNYLMFFEGVRNTKATFSIALTGNALPIKLVSFTGKNINNTTNELAIKIAEAKNVSTVEVERSSDSRNFTAIGLLNKIGNSFTGSHSFTDAKALKGINYYRLKTTDVDGTIEYSSIVAITIADNVIVNLQPNPFSNFITVKSQQVSSKFTVTISDAVMKKVKQSSFSGSVEIPTSSLAKGTYIISVYSADGKLLLTKKMLKE